MNGGYDGRRHVTYRGKVVYRRERRPFSGKDLVRIAIAVHNGSQADYTSWRAVGSIAARNCLDGLHEEPTPGQESEAVRRLGQTFEEFLSGFDLVVRAFKIFGPLIPGMAFFTGIISGLYEYVRETFPVYVNKGGSKE